MPPEDDIPPMPSDGDIPSTSEQDRLFADIVADLSPDIPPGFQEAPPPPSVVPPDSSDAPGALLVPMPAEAVPASKRLPMPRVKLKGNVSQAQRDYVDGSVIDMVTTNARGAAMVCEGPRVTDGDKVILEGCPYAKKCPLLRVALPAPVGDDCPVEEAAIQRWMTQYSMELDVNPHDTTMGYAHTSALQLAGLRAVLQRAFWGMAINPKLEQELTNVTPQGVINIVKSGNYNVDYVQDLIKTSLKVAKENLQTPMAKIVVAKSGFKDNSRHTAAVAERMRHVTEVQRTMKVDDKGLPTELTEIHKFDQAREKEISDRHKKPAVIDVTPIKKPDPPPPPPPPPPPTPGPSAPTR